MAPNPDESKKTNQTIARGAPIATRTDARAAFAAAPIVGAVSAAAHKAGTAGTTSKPGATPPKKTGGATTNAPTKIGGITPTSSTKAGATTASSKAGAAGTAAKAGATPVNKTGSATTNAPTKTGGATATTSTKAGAATATPTNAGVTGPSKKSSTTSSVDGTNKEPDWGAIRAQEAHKNPKVKSEKITGGVALLGLFIRNQDETKSTTHRACPRIDVRKDVSKNNRTVPIPK